MLNLDKDFGKPRKEKKSKKLCCIKDLDQMRNNFIFGIIWSATLGCTKTY